MTLYTASRPVTPRLRDAWDRAWNNGDVGALDDLLSVDYRRTGLTDGRTFDREGMKTVILEARAAFPDLRTTIARTVEDESSVAVLWRCTGTHRGSFAGVPPTERRIDVSGASFCRTHDGLIVEEVETQGAREMLSALGVHWLSHVRPEQA